MISLQNSNLLIPFEHFAAQSSSTQLLLLQFITKSATAQEPTLNEYEQLCFSLLPSVKFVTSKSKGPAVEHDLLNFYLLLGLKDTPSFLQTIRVFNQHMEQAAPEAQRHANAAPYPSYLSSSSSHQTDQWNSAQSNIWLQVLDDYFTNPGPSEQQRLDALLASPYLSFRSQYGKALEDLSSSKLPTYFPLQQSYDRARGCHPLDLALAFSNIPLLESLWDKNADKAAWNQAIEKTLKTDSTSRLHYGGTQNAGPLHKVSFFDARLWIQSPEVLRFLSKKSTTEPKNIHISNKVALSFYASEQDAKTPFYNTLLEDVYSAPQDAFSFFVKLMRQHEEALSNVKNTHALAARTSSYKPDSQHPFYAYSPVQQSLMERMIEHAKKIYALDPQKVAPPFTPLAFNKNNIGSQLQTLKQALLFSTPTFRTALWEQLPATSCALCLFERPHFQPSEISSLIDLYPQVPEEKFLDTLVLAAPLFNHFPSNTDESPFHTFIRKSSAPLLDAFLEKLAQKEPTLLSILLSTECWTLQSLELRKKGDAFSVAVGTGDADKLTVLRKHGPHLSQERAKETLKYLKSRNTSVHQMALSAFEKILLENMLNTLSSQDTEPTPITSPRKRL